MTETRIIGIRSTLHARIPADEARRLGLRPGQRVPLDVRPLGSTADEVLALRGPYGAAFRKTSGRELWEE